MVQDACAGYIETLLASVKAGRFEYDADVFEAASLLVPGRDPTGTSSEKAASALVVSFGELFFKSVASDDAKQYASTKVSTDLDDMKMVLEHDVHAFLSQNKESDWKGDDDRRRDICKHIGRVLDAMKKDGYPQEGMLREFWAFVLSFPVTTVIVEAHFSMYTRQTCTKKASVGDETVANVCLLKDHIRAQKIELGLEENRPGLWLHLASTWEQYYINSKTIKA